MIQLRDTRINPRNHFPEFRSSNALLLAVVKIYRTLRHCVHKKWAQNPLCTKFPNFPSNHHLSSLLTYQVSPELNASQAEQWYQIKPSSKGLVNTFGIFTWKNSFGAVEESFRHFYTPTEPSEALEGSVRFFLLNQAIWRSGGLCKALIHSEKALWDSWGLSQIPPPETSPLALWKAWSDTWTLIPSPLRL